MVHLRAQAVEGFETAGLHALHARASGFVLGTQVAVQLEALRVCNERRENDV